MTLRRFLAVTHEATITGAPINLCHLLGWMRRNTDIEVHTLILRDGPLRERFAEHGDVTVLDSGTVSKGLHVLQQGLVHLGSSRAWHPVAKARLTPQLRHLRDFDMVYLNSTTSLAVQEFLPPTRATVSHVHELQVALRTWTPARNREMFATVPDRWIAASHAVEDLLVGEVGLPADRVLLHHEFIDTAAILSREVSLREVEATRQSVGIDPDAAVVLGTGTLDWRKGPDLFVQLASELCRRSDRPVELVWVGGDMGGADWQRVRSDIERTGATNVHFVGLKKDPMPWFAMADVFALTSREDPFPLVCLENATLGTPIVTYRNGGMPELLAAAGAEAAQGIIEYMDVGAMADQVIRLLSSEDLAKKAGTQLRDRVISTHDVDVAAPKLAADLMSLL
jgi:glycosyltransferase involved in cell wall biosynthesis